MPSGLSVGCSSILLLELYLAIILFWNPFFNFGSMNSVVNQVMNKVVKGTIPSLRRAILAALRIPKLVSNPIPSPLTKPPPPSSSCFCYYPTFPFGYPLPAANQIKNRFEARNVATNETSIWADSVKKKRKKKMNKHKYKKLRKRLRRKTGKQ